MKKFYVTTAIPYVNAVPHIGHALEYVQTDVIARFQKQQGREVYYLTGTDDNALKNVEAAEKHGVSVADYVKKNADIFEAVLKELGVSNNDFIRTTEKRHVEGVQKFWRACEHDIYKKKYKGLYCVGCETFYLEKDLIDGKCPEHKTVPETIEEENYFFKLSSYQAWLEKLIESDELKITPEFRKNEVLSFIRGGLEDFSISRSVKRAKGWGIPVPGDPEQIIYVWFDALTNYITALGWQGNGELFQQCWPADVQVIGKGISRFHAIYWPAMLKSAGVAPPKELFIHGYVTVNKEKISKSLGNVIDPFEEVKKYGVDAVRYYLLKEIPAYSDGDYSDSRFIEVYNADLANNLGNVVSRVAKLAEGNIYPVSFPKETDKEIQKAVQNFKFDEALKIIFNRWIDSTNVDLNNTKPWILDPSDEKRAIYLASYVQNLVTAAYYLEPFIPETSEKIKNIFSGIIKPLEKPLFPRIVGDVKTIPVVKNKSLSSRAYWVDKLATEVGVKFQVAEVYGVKVKRKNSELEKEKKAIAEVVKKTDYTDDLILLGYKHLFETIGVKNVLSSPDSLLQLVIDKGILPTINTVVDAYNVKSTTTRLVVSAHDLDKLTGDVGIVTTTGSEIFYPLGSVTREKLPIKEWAAVDDNHVLCRLNCKQSELSKVTLATKNLLIYVQGSKTTSDEYLRQSLEDICKYIVKYNGGEYMVLAEKNG